MVEWFEVRAAVRRVFDLPVPAGTPCPQDWREYAVLRELKRLWDAAAPIKTAQQGVNSSPAPQKRGAE